MVDDRGKKHPKVYPTLQEALAVKHSLLQELGLIAERSVSGAIEAYAQARVDDGRKQSSVDVTSWRLRSFFVGVLDLPFNSLSSSRCQALYDDYRRRPTRTGKPPASTTQLNVLEEAKTFGHWCAYEMHWLPANPLIPIDGVGTRTHGKSQLRISEARKWEAAAFTLVRNGDAERRRAVAALLTLYQNLRECEVLALTARNVDDHGRKLWIADSKTRAGRRLLDVAEPLQALLVAVAEDLPPHGRLFPHGKGWVRKQVQRICKLAGVPVVNAQSMRGLHATLAIEGGTSPHAVATSMGHTSFRVTERSYVAPGTTDRIAARNALAVLQGGKS